MNRILTLILLFSCLAHLYAQRPDDPNLWQDFSYDMESVLGGIAYSYSRPLYWDGTDWAHFGGLMGVTGLTYLVDDPVSEYFVGIREDVPRVIRDYGKQYGNPSNNYMLTGAVYLTGWLTKNPKLRRTGVLLISSASSAGLLQQILKSAVGRARPASGQSKDTFKPLWGGNRDYHSFPSGHTILAFTNAYAIAKQFRSPWVKAGIYTVGLVPGISRLWEGKHWLSDVLFSVGVSIFTVEAIDRYLDRRYSEKYQQDPDQVQWDLRFGPGTVGLVLQF